MQPLLVLETNQVAAFVERTHGVHFSSLEPLSIYYTEAHEVPGFYIKVNSRSSRLLTRVKYDGEPELEKIEVRPSPTSKVFPAPSTLLLNLQENKERI